MALGNRSVQIAAMIAIAVASAGLLTGIRPRPREVWGAPPAIEATSEAPLAPTHAALGSDDQGWIAARQRAGSVATTTAARTSPNARLSFQRGVSPR